MIEANVEMKTKEKGWRERQPYQAVLQARLRRFLRDSTRCRGKEPEVGKRDVEKAKAEIFVDSLC